MSLFLRKVKMNNKNQRNNSKKISTEKPDQLETASTKERKPSFKVREKKDLSSKDLSSTNAEESTSAVATKESVEKETKKKEALDKGSSIEKNRPKKEGVTKGSVKLSGLYAFKLAMSSIYDEKGKFTPVTFLEVKPWKVSQIKQKEKTGYNSVQVACMPQKNKRSSKALKAHLSPAGFEEGARYVREIRQDSVDNIEVGQTISIHSIQKGDKVKLQAVSKGHGFAGVVKRWGFRGGPASHGSKTHRTSGSIGNRTEPARVMPGKKMAGHYGVEKVSLRNVQVMDVVEEKNLIVVRGPVPGARNSLVFLSQNTKSS